MVKQRPAELDCLATTDDSSLQRLPVVRIPSQDQGTNEGGKRRYFYTGDIRMPSCIDMRSSCLEKRV